MSKPLDELYLRWLYDQVGNGGSNPRQTHWELIKQLFTKEFVWIIPNDDNRIEDGLGLRYEFLDEINDAPIDMDWMSIGCSMLEMLMGLSRRLSFEAEGDPRDWFWHLIGNLGLSTFSDSIYDDHYRAEIDEVLDTVIYRLYEPDGKGGIFPLQSPCKDQTEVELWYQLNAYLLERD